MRKRKRRNVARIVAGVLCLAVALCGVGYLAKDYIHLAKNADVIADVAEKVTIEPVKEEADDYVWETDENLLRKIDFDSLKSQNGDVESWMFVPDTGIDSYVMREPTVGYYKYDLRGLDGSYNGCGSFLFPAEPNNADDAHQLLLGHRMISYNGTKDWQFSMLPNRWGDASGAESFPHVYLYYPDHSERWKVWCALDAWYNDDIYLIPYELGADDYGALLAHTADISRYQQCETPDKWTRTLYLSTCNRPNGGALMRFCLVLVPDVSYEYETGELTTFSEEHAREMWMRGNDDTRAKALDDIAAQVREMTMVETQEVEEGSTEE